MAPRPKTTLTFITSNTHKLAEVRSILGSSVGGLALKSQSLDLAEMQARDVEEIAADKCRRAAALVS